jgi:hypothetical protein
LPHDAIPIAMPRRFLNQCDMSETIGPNVPEHPKPITAWAATSTQMFGA